MAGASVLLLTILCATSKYRFYEITTKVVSTIELNWRFICFALIGRPSSKSVIMWCNEKLVEWIKNWVRLKTTLQNQNFLTFWKILIFSIFLCQLFMTGIRRYRLKKNTPQILFVIIFYCYQKSV
jgi:hypothetical protein